MDVSHSNLNIWLILPVSACLLAPAGAQTTKPLATPWMTVPSRPVISPMPSRPATSPAASTNTVTFHEPKLWESAPQPPATLRQVSAHLSGTLVGQSPGGSITFVLLLENNGLREVTILDPLDFFSLQFTTMGSKLIGVPERISKILIDAEPSKDAIPGTKRDMPYPAPVQFRRIVRVNGPTSQKEETITIPSGNKIQIVFESEPVVMQRVMQALRAETGENAKSFKARATMSLVAALPQPGVGGQLLDSDWIFFTIPSS